MEELKANYLTSIYEDCRIFLEGIELFISRDYPKFWTNMEAGRPLTNEEIKRYTRELKYFEGQLDALYEEFISYAGTSANKKAGGQEKVKALEAKIYQILAYAYMRTGDFAMSYALMANEKIVAQDVTIPLMDIEGKQKTFRLTRDLKNLHSLISANLNTIELRMKYFFPTDLEAINAYLKVNSYSQLNPVNVTFLSYYDKAFLELGENTNDIIHFSEIIHFFNQIKYNNAFSQGTSDTIGQERVYRLPIIKGEYGMDLKDSTILGAVSSDNRVLSLERLCRYKGFTRTDFRTLKVEEKQNIKNKATVDKELYISRADGDPAGHLNDGARMEYFGNVPKDGKLVEGTPLRYGTYSLFEGTQFLGIIELVPCYKGQPCTKRNSDKAVTEVKVYNHELTFYEDTLDFIRMNTRMYGKMGTVTRPEANEIHIGRGCASGKK
ncbi:hypothetical protein DSLASN_14940 [Desulfoluna limicola]|uniref:Uncharacterized protein n=2 Tax=Desulfoluna limicola TaxID=2810562 RepID=A0ABN6F003_9BACT|nr:hypothetical protein DSLASN_14940 [Desulfoluna limicola]